jgi:ABC-type branched-subunit amino acid transport system substrate-binding protein
MSFGHRRSGRGIARPAGYAVVVAAGLVTLTVAQPGPAQATPTCMASNTVTADVVALDQLFFYNRYGAHNPGGMMFALRRDVVDRSGRTEAEGGMLSPGNVMLRGDKRPRPLVLRVNEGECLRVHFQNLLAPSPVDNQQPATRTASVHVMGMSYVDGPATDDGAYVGRNPSSLMPPGGSTTYTVYAEKEGTHLLYSGAAITGGEGDGGSLAMGLFGAVNIEPAGAEWYRSQLTRQEIEWASVGTLPSGHPDLDYDAVYPAGHRFEGQPILKMRHDNEIIHSDLTAVITGSGRGHWTAGAFGESPVLEPNAHTAQVPGLPLRSREEPFREFTIIFHDEAFAIQAFPEFEDEVNGFAHTLHSVRDTFPINYGTGGIGAEILANRKGVGPVAGCNECKYEEFFLSSWAVGDPAMIVDVPAGAQDPDDPEDRATTAYYADDPSNVYHSYLGDRVKFRNIHAGPHEHHIFHLHAHQWLFAPDSDGSAYLDSQAIGPGSTYTYHGQEGEHRLHHLPARAVHRDCPIAHDAPPGRERRCPALDQAAAGLDRATDRDLASGSGRGRLELILHASLPIQAIAGHLRRTLRLFAAGSILIAASLTESTAQAGGPDDQERLGMKIYNEGVSPSGSPIYARIGAAGIRLPATAAPCGGCHGEDGGLGRPEGGVVPPPITWEVLTKPFGHRHADGRRHPPFQRDTLARAITDGHDPAGNRLDPSMPRYEMSAEDLHSLLAYIGRLGAASEPGITDEAITLGLLLLRTEASGEAAVSAEIISAYFDDLNARGGIYGRRIRLVREESGEHADAIDAAVSRLLEKPIFALIGAIPPWLQPDVIRHSEAEGVPLVHLLPPAPGTEPGEHSFFLLSGLQQEAQCLLASGAENRSSAPISVAILVDTQQPFERQLAERLSAAAEAEGGPAPHTVPSPRSSKEARRLIGELRREGIGSLLVLGAGPGLGKLAKAAIEAGWTPDLLVPGSLVGALIPELPPRFTNRLMLAYPTLPSDWKPDRLQALALLRERQGVPADPLLPQVLGRAAADLVTEVLKRTGRTVTRERFVQKLESLYRFGTGLTPPLTYGPNRRIGAMGAYLVEMPAADAPTITPGEWCEASG